MSNLQSLIDEYVERHGSSYRAICERLGWSHGTISSWFKRTRTNPPMAVELRALAVQIQTPYKRVLDATLLDFGYLPEEGSEHGKRSAKKIDDEVATVEVLGSEELEVDPPIKPHRGPKTGS